MKRALLLAVVAVLLSTVVSAQSRPASQPTLQGVWRVAEVTTTGPNASTTTQPQPGLCIFTGKHYSFIRVTADKPRPAPADVTKATAAELLAVWQPFQANAGTYEVAGGNLTMRSLVAKSPGVMSEGAFFVDSFKLEGNTLWLTAVRNQNGPVTNPVTLKLTRVE